MRNVLLTVCALTLMTTGVQATQIDLTVTYDGTANGDISKITDGYFPAENVWGYGTPPLPDRWDGVNNVNFNSYGTGDNEIFYFDFDGSYRLEDVKLSVDNNDRYTVDYYTGSGWSNLFTIMEGYGSAYRSMDKFSTVETDPSTDYDYRINFSAVETTKLRLYAYTTPYDDFFAIGEFQAFGTAIPGNGTPVPEPTTMLLFGTGLIGLAGVARRKKK